jgi:TRAP-type C4-dicarboxylate transport system permease small subunit
LTIRASEVAERVGRVCAALGATAVALMMAHICLDVAIRVVLKIPIYGTIEIVSKYMMVVIAFAPVAELQRRREHLFVESFTSLAPARVNAVLDYIVIIYFFALTCFYIYAATLKALDKTRVFASIETPAFILPVWPTYWVIPVMLAAVAVVLLVQILSGPTRAPAHIDQTLPRE